MAMTLFALRLAVAGKGGLVVCLSTAGAGVATLLVSIKEAAEQLGVSPDTVRRMAASGLLRTTRISLSAGGGGRAPRRAGRWQVCGPEGASSRPLVHSGNES